MTNIEIRKGNGHLTPLDWGFMSPMIRRFENIFNFGLEPGDFQPSCDIDETDKGYQITFDVPGFKKDDVNIEVTGNMLTVSGERKFEKKREAKGEYYHERRYGSFKRSFALPDGVSSDKVQAEYSDGVLTLMIPKGIPQDVKKIQISSRPDDVTAEKKKTTH